MTSTRRSLLAVFAHPDDEILYGGLLADAAARGDAKFVHLDKALRGRGVTDGLDADLFGVTPSMVALSFDATPYLAQRRGALAAQRSQRWPLSDAFDGLER